jgi:hypothetical protein
VLRSQNQENATWLKSNDAAIGFNQPPPSGFGGFSFQMSVVDDSALVYQNVTLAAGTYTVSFYSRLTDNGGNPSSVNVTLSTNVYNVPNDGTANWVRRSFTATVAAGTFQFEINVASSTSVSGQFYGFQIEPGTVASTYNPTFATALLGQRFDYDPVTLAAKGLLIEEQRTNLQTYSNDFSNAVWAAASGAKIVAASAFVSPDGNVNAWTVTDSSAVAFDGIYQPVTVPVDSATYTGSIYIRKTTGGTSATFGINMLINGGTNVNNNVRINTDLGTVLTGTATVTDVNSYWRVACPITNNGTAGNTTLSMSLFPATNTYNLSASVATATGSATIYGAQIETGTFATSYIPTVASQVTRVADSASIDTLTPWYNATEGSLFVQFSCPGYDAAVFPPIAVLGTTSVSNRGYSHVINGSTNDSGFNIYDNTPTYQGVPGFAAYTKGATRKQIGAYKVNNSAATSDGAAATTDTTVTLPTSLNTLTIGRYAIAGTARLNGHIQTINYYPTRLTNAKLQSLTT